MTDGTREANAAAAWWASLLADPDVGDTRPDLTPTVTAEQVDIFRNALRSGVLAEWKHAPLILDTDLGPSPLLDDAMSAANIPGLYRRLLLPSHYTMWMEPGKVTVDQHVDGPFTDLDLGPTNG